MYEISGTGATPFWTTAGGTLPIDLGGTVPTFGDEIILRGGKFELTITNQATSTVDDIKVKIYRMTTGNNPDFTTYFPGPLTLVDQAWDPSVEPDLYTQVGKPWLAREVLLKEGESYTFVTRFKSQKIDQDAYLNMSRSPYIIVQYGNVGNSSAHSLEIKRSYNLSFSGDVV